MGPGRVQRGTLQHQEVTLAKDLCHQLDPLDTSIDQLVLICIKGKVLFKPYEN